MYHPIVIIVLEVGLVILVVSLVVIAVLYAGWKDEAIRWKKHAEAISKACDRRDEQIAEDMAELEERRKEKRDGMAEEKYLSELATACTDRNRALEMHQNIRLWRERYWKNVTCCLVRALFRTKDGPGEALMIALKAEYDRETGQLIGDAKKITDWPPHVGARERCKPPSEDRSAPCEPSSSPEEVPDAGD